jgi:membrane-associated phospholipid phosphatase
VTSSSVTSAEAPVPKGFVTRPAFAWLSHSALAGAVLVLVATLAGWLTMIAHTQAGVIGLDDAAHSVVSLHSDKALNNVMRALTSFGDELTLLFLFVALAVWAYAARGVWWARFFVLVAAGGLALDNIIKPFVGRPRPIFDQLVSGRGPSWPSGHTTGTTALLVALAIYASAGRGRGLQIASWTAALSGSILMGITRVYLGVHWPTDVMAGVILGVAWAVACDRLLVAGARPRAKAGRALSRRLAVAVLISLATAGTAIFLF